MCQTSLNSACDFLERQLLILPGVATSSELESADQSFRSNVSFSYRPAQFLAAAFAIRDHCSKHCHWDNALLRCRVWPCLNKRRKTIPILDPSAMSARSQLLQILHAYALAMSQRWVSRFDHILLAHCAAFSQSGVASERGLLAASQFEPTDSGLPK